jgi:hypothetical protein
MALLPTGSSSTIYNRKLLQASSYPAASTQGTTPARYVIFVEFAKNHSCVTLRFSLVTALAACPLPVSWSDQSEGLFLLASACPDENDSEDETKNNSRGVIKLRLLTTSQILQSPADVQANKRASAVVCSLVCDRRHKALLLAKNLTLNICEGMDVNRSSSRAIYIVATVIGGFSAWCITAEHFSSMQKGNIQTIPSFKCSHTRLFICV